MRDKWDEPGDNIYVWDFRSLETEGGLYLKDANAEGDSHPNKKFSKKAAPLFCRRVVDVIRGAGDTASKTGETKKEAADAGSARPPSTGDKPRVG